MTSVPRFVLVLLWGLFVALHATAEPSAPAVVPSDAAPSPASASSDDAARAKALFQEARNLVAAGDYNAACPRFEQSAKLVEGLGTLFNLADCWTHLRRTQSAATLYRKVERLALANGQDQRADVARQRAIALEASLSKLLIRLEDPHKAGLVVEQAMSHPGHVLIEAVVDPYLPPLPAKITTDQALNFVGTSARSSFREFACAAG